MAVVRQGEQDIRRAREARADAVVVLFDERGQVLRRLRPHAFGEHAKVQRQYVSCLKLLQ